VTLDQDKMGKHQPYFPPTSPNLPLRRSQQQITPVISGKLGKKSKKES